MSSNRDNIDVDIDLRVFFLSDDIDNASIGKMCFQLLCLLKQDDKNEAEKKDFVRKPIHIYVNSGGGEVYDMWALIDIICTSKTPIYTYCTGYAMSAAFKIFLAGHKRFVSQHATLLYHQVSCYRFGKYQDLVEDRVEMDYIQSNLEQYVLRQTKITKKMLREIREKKIDRIFHVDEALKLGIAHELLV